MSTKVKSKQKTIIIGLTVLGCLLILFFGTRAFRAFKKFNGHPPPPSFASELQTNTEEISDWMTIPFIAYSYGVHPKILFEALDIPPKGNDKKSLKELNDEYFPESDGLVIQLIKAEILANQPPPTPAPPNIPPPEQTEIPPAAP
jgi:hypothetical protein